jgi:hypothetical protein
MFNTGHSFSQILADDANSSGDPETCMKAMIREERIELYGAKERATETFPNFSCKEPLQLERFSLI